MTLDQSKFRSIANKMFLILSCAIIVYFLIQITDNIIVRIGIIIFAVGLDIFMQYVLAIGKLRWRTKGFGSKCRAAILMLLYMIYVLVYAVPSATGFFLAEIEAKEKSQSGIVIKETIAKNRLSQINVELNTLQDSLKNEAKTGYGERSVTITARIDKLTKEQEKLIQSLQTKVSTINKITPNAFASLAGIITVPENLIKILIFGTSVLMLYVGLILTSWELENKKNEQKEPVNEHLKYLIDG